MRLLPPMPPAFFTPQIRKSGILLALLCAVALAVAGCGGSSAGSGTTITLYNAQHEQTTAR